MSDSDRRSEHPDEVAAWGRLIEQAPLAMAVMTGAEHTIVGASPAMARLVGIVPADMRLRPLTSLLPPAHAPQVTALLDEALASGATGDAAVLEHTGASGDRVRWHYTIWPIRRADGSEVGLTIRIQEALAPTNDDTLTRQLQEANERLLVAGLREHTARSEAEAALAELSRAQDALRRSRDELEQKVAERTQELAVQNQQLQEAVTALEQAEQIRQELYRRLLNAEEAERRRIARELHDQLGQELAVLHLELAPLAAPPAKHVELAERATRLRQIAQQIDSTVHRLALELRPTALDDVGLAQALHTHLQTWAQRTGIAAHFTALGAADGPVPAELSTTIYRVVQEALTNVLKHAGARQVSVIFERRPDQIGVIVEDDGRGFDPDTATTRLGLQGMRERLALVGGVLTIESSPVQGTSLFIRIPLDKESGAVARGG